MAKSYKQPQGESCTGFRPDVETPASKVDRYRYVSLGTNHRTVHATYTVRVAGPVPDQC